MNKCNKIILPLLLACLHNTVFAGGPLITSNVTDEPVVYPDGGANIVLNYDQETLGTRSNAQTDALVNQALSLWNDVSTSTVSISQGDDLPFDVDETNFTLFLNVFSDNINPVIFDTDGEITDALFGVGAKDFVLGFAGSAYFTQTGIFVEGRAVINGFIDVSDTTLIIVFAHEFGHFFGLDHTQLDSTQGLTSSNYPLMYPIAFRNQDSLHEDDVAAVSTLYPETSIIDTSYGTLTGSFHQDDGTVIRGANIWAQEVSTGETYSTISDYLITGTGDFTLKLPPGTYTVHAESIQTNFTGGSSVGPYSETLSDLSFIDPHPITPVKYGSAGTDIDAQVTITAGDARTIDFNQSGIIDADGDGIFDSLDTCPAGETGWTSDATTDFDTDGCRDATEDLDDDNDGLNDLFETDNGLDPLDTTGVNGADGDADGDSFTNIEEQAAGSDASAATGATSNPGFFNFSHTAYNVNENAGTASINVTRTGGSVGAVSVLCFTTDIPDQAIAGTDYTAVGNTLNWIDGDAATKDCDVVITADTDIEGNETFQLDLSNPTGGAKLGL